MNSDPSTPGRRTPRLDAHHHFSFASYHDPNGMNWGNLRVWDDDIIAPAPASRSTCALYYGDQYLLREGAISREDNLGNKGRTEAGTRR